MGKYNIREKKKTNPAYRSLIKPETADALEAEILRVVIVEKRYKNPDYSAKDLARDLKTNTRYLSAVVNTRFGLNYSEFVNQYRILDACNLLRDKRHTNKTIEEIGAMVGFANRQSFYGAFYKFKKDTPKQYRKKHFATCGK